LNYNQQHSAHSSLFLPGLQLIIENITLFEIKLLRMNFNLTQIPERISKPRLSGLTMVMDKGLSVTEAQNFLSAAHPHVDIVKLGFGTSFVTPNLKEKLEIYRSYNIPIYFGGTLFEAFLIRNQFDDYIKVCKDFGINYMEVSDGSVTIPHAEKCGYIEKLTKYGTVLSEVGSKDAAHIIPPYKWIELMKAELEAGSTYVIAEAREAGNVGIYRGSGEVREGLVQEILTQISGDKIVWEAPQKAQQLYFIELLGCNVNLGNIAPSEVIPLETMRIGLRADTFSLYLDKKENA
jgi:phosphosulfolactate synthase